MFSAKYIKVFVISITLMLLVFGVNSTSSFMPKRNPTINNNSIVHLDGFEQLPFSFTRNLGQFSPEVKFLARTSAGSLYLTNDEAVLLISHQSHNGSLKQLNKLDYVSTTSSPPISTTVLRYQLTGADIHPNIVGLDELPGKSNYFVGSNPKNWHTNVPTYAKVEYQNIYPGINLAWYGSSGGLEYDFTLQAGADPSTIHMKIAGANSLALEGNDLVLHTAVGDLRQAAPRIYQDTPTGRHDISGGYNLTADGEIGFSVAAYDHSRSLVIDPFLDYSSYFNGGSPEAIAVDTAGNTYITGITYGGSLPLVNAFQPYFAGTSDAFITKIDPTGQNIVYSTYLGGSDEDNGADIAVDINGFAYVIGTTNSSNFPLANAADGQLGYYDAFIAKLSPAGNSLVYSTYLGGDWVETGYGIAVDAQSNAYATGRTMSANFPTLNPLQPTRHSDLYSDAFVTKFSPAGMIVYSTYLGGNAEDDGFSIAVDNQGSTYITGRTESTDFPTYNPLEPSLHNVFFDAFITKINPSGNALIYSTYLGGSGSEEGYAIAVDGSNEAVVFGRTYSPDFPTQNAVQSQLASLGRADAFITKLNSEGLGLVYSTYFGGSDEEFPRDMVVSRIGEVYFTGWTQSTDYPRYNLNLPFFATSGAALTKLSATGQVEYSGYFGGSAGDTAWGIAADERGNVYIDGKTGPDTTFPLVNPLEPVNDGTNSFFLKIDAAIYTPTPTPTLALYEFYDVPVGSIWHDYVHYLASHGIVSGVSPGYYAPNQNTTRAQFAKIVTLGLGYQLITPTQPSFTDVPPSNFAYTFIETAHAHSIISGYTPMQCTNNGRTYPCFGPNDQITRAQLVVITVGARGWSLITPTIPTFSDVPAGVFAYPQIETAVSRGIISGYADNQSYHPCADAGVGSPCFRPRNFGTRGQLAKIVYNTITYPTEIPTPTNTTTPTNTAIPADTATPLPSTATASVTITPLSSTETATPSATQTTTPLPLTNTPTLLPTLTPTSVDTATPTNTPIP